jgi:sialate O-acetylesterase
MFLTLPVVLACLCGRSAADVKPNALISENMVLQQGVSVPLWGAADDGEDVKVAFQDQEVKTTAKDGKWMVRLEKLKAGGPFPMTIAGKNRIELKNVLVGEVWVCSGQSNMEWKINQSAEPEKVKAASRNPKIRLFTVQRNPKPQPQTDIPVVAKDGKGIWLECGPDAIDTFSAVAYHFGRSLQPALDVPVGLIHTSFGGTAAQRWTRKEILEQTEGLKGLTGSDLYNGMIAPLIPYAIKGVIWYQGEANTSRAYQYRTLFPAMIKNWRDDWKQGDFPFLFVQLAPYGNKNNKLDTESIFYAELREAQLLTSQKVPSTAMAVITDVGHETNIHPPQKAPVGERLALAAQAIAYGRKLVYSGPVYDSMKIEDGKAILSFKHVGGGLVAKGSELLGFTICGEDRKFVKAQAEIREDKVIVWSPDVPRPVAVRYGWANYAVVNLFNKDGLPATPFRTDDFPLITAPKPAAGAAGQ